MMKTEIEKTATIVNLEKRLFWYAFLVYTAMAISIVLSINGIYRMALSNLDPLKQMPEFLFGFSVVEVSALVVGLALALSIQKAFELESEARGFTGSFAVENKIKISLVILAFMDTMIMTNGSYEAYRYAENLQIEKQKANDIRADKKVLDSFYVDLKQSEEVILAYKTNLKKVINLSGEELKSVLSTGADDTKLKIDSINKIYDKKSSLYKKDDTKNQNWIETQRMRKLKEITPSEKRVSKQEYVSNLQNMIDVESDKKAKLLAEIKVISEKMDTDNYERASTLFLYLTALLLAVAVTLFAWRMNTRRGEIKKSMETQIKTLQTRAANNVNGNGSGEGELVRLIREAREKQDAEYALEDEAVSKDEGEILFEKIVEISKKHNRTEDGKLLKSSYPEIESSTGMHSRKHKLAMDWARMRGLVKEEGTKTFIRELEVA